MHVPQTPKSVPWHQTKMGLSRGGYASVPTTLEKLDYSIMAYGFFSFFLKYILVFIFTQINKGHFNFQFYICLFHQSHLNVLN